MHNKLKVFRAMYDLTQETLAQKLRVTRQTVISIEKEQYDPSLQLAFRIASLFKVKIEDIFLPFLAETDNTVSPFANNSNQ